MKKVILITLLLLVSILALQTSGLARLIDYERLNRIKASRIAADAAAKEDEAPADIGELPQWLKSEAKVTNDAERLYDANRDGKLQSAEAKILFRDVLDQVESKGGMTINSDILKQYDKNKDGFISRLEAVEIKKFVR